METLKTRWAALSQREQVLIGIMLVLLALLMLTFAVIRPVRAWMEEAQPRLAKAEQVRTSAAAAAEAVAERPSMTAQLPLSERLAAAAGNAGFELTRNQPAPDNGAEIEIASAKAPALYALLKLMESQGVTVRRATMTPRNDGTLGVVLVLGEAR